MVEENGLEWVPGSHQRWDTEEELNVRLELCGHRHQECLDSGLEIPLGAGDLLVFSANLIHRGLYGKHRMALDILFFSGAMRKR